MSKRTIPGLLFLSLFLCAGISTTVLADDGSQGELNAAADQYNRNKSEVRYKVVCRMEAPIGSRIKRKVCRTVTVIERSSREAKRILDRMRTSVGDQ